MSLCHSRRRGFLDPCIDTLGKEGLVQQCLFHAKKKRKKQHRGLWDVEIAGSQKPGKDQTGKNVSEATEANFKRQEKRSLGVFFLSIFLAATQKSGKRL